MAPRRGKRRGGNVWRTLLDLGDEACSKVCSKLLAVALEHIDIGVKCYREATNDSLAVLELAELRVKDRVNLLLDQASYRCVLGGYNRSSCSGCEKDASIERALVDASDTSGRRAERGLGRSIILRCRRFRSFMDSGSPWARKARRVVVDVHREGDQRVFSNKRKINESATSHDLQVSALACPRIPGTPMT